MISTATNIDNYYIECFRSIKANVKYSSLESKKKIILVTSSSSKEGSTTVALNLANAFAEDKKVLLIDANLRTPALATSFNKKNSVGLTNVLFNEMKANSAIYKCEENLHVLFSGSNALNPGEILDSDNIVELLNDLTAKYDYIVIDSTPLGIVADTQYLIPKVDGIVLVVNDKKTKKQRLKYVKQIIDQAQGHLLGVIINNSKYSKEGISNYY